MSSTLSWLTKNRLSAALDRVKTDQGVAASDWTLFRGAVFGRDSLIVALDLLEWQPELVERIIMSLARLQGTRHNGLTEEEPGKIHHEHRTLYHNGELLDAQSAELLAQIAGERGIGSRHGFTYYGASDATVQYIRVLAAYVRRYGRSILATTFTHHTGTVRTVGDSLHAAIDWTAGRVETSSLGLLEFQRTNPHGLKWHVLRDGTVSYVHADGNMANTEAPIASLELQGLTYDALLDAADTFPDHADAPTWTSLAERLRLHTLLLFWMPREHYFAMAIDRDCEGRPRQLQAITSMPGELLDTRFFDDLPEPYDRRRLLDPIIKRLYAPELITPVGPRMRSLLHAGLLPYSDYQGSYTSWPVITGIIARGFIRQGFDALARDFENRYLRGIDRVQACTEFFYVDLDGRIAVRSSEDQTGHDELAGVNAPELNQAWTISAAIRALHHQASRRSDTGWETHLATGILSQVPLGGRRVRLVPMIINQHEGRRLEAAYMTSQGYGYEIAKAPWLQNA